VPEIQAKAHCKSSSTNHTYIWESVAIFPNPVILTVFILLSTTFANTSLTSSPNTIWLDDNLLSTSDWNAQKKLQHCFCLPLCSSGAFHYMKPSTLAWMATLTFTPGEQHHPLPLPTSLALRTTRQGVGRWKGYGYLLQQEGKPLLIVAYWRQWRGLSGIIKDQRRSLLSYLKLTLLVHHAMLQGLSRVFSQCFRKSRGWGSRYRQYVQDLVFDF